MEVLVGGQKVKLESQNSDRKSKYWKESRSTAQYLVCIRVCGSWTACCWTRTILYAVPLKGYVIGKAHALYGNRSTWHSSKNCVDFNFLSLWLSDRNTFLCVQYSNPSKSYSQDSPSKTDMWIVNSTWTVKGCEFVCGRCHRCLVSFGEVCRFTAQFGEQSMGLCCPPHWCNSSQNTNMDTHNVS